MRRLAARALMIALGGTGALGCASDPAPVRIETYVDRVQGRVQSALEEPRFLLRHNPAAECGCPAFELKLGAVWQRVELAAEEDDPAVMALQQLIEPVLDTRARDRRVFEVEGRLEDAVGLCGRGGLYVSLVPTALVGVVAPD